MSEEIVSPAASGDLDIARLAAWRAVGDAAAAVIERISQEMESASGLPLEWYYVLLHLYEEGNGSLPQHALVSHSRLSQSGTSRMVSNMEKAGLLRRRPSEHDRRNLDVVLTERGRDVLIRATPGHHAAVQQHFGAWLSDDESALVTRAMQKVLRGLDAERGTSARPELDQLLAYGESVMSLKSGTVVVKDAASTRDALEPLLLKEAARHITTEAVHELRAIVTGMATLIDEPKEFFRADWELHRKLAEFCHNEVLRSVYLALLDIVSSHVDGVVSTQNLTSYLYERLAIHARIVDAVASGDHELVEAAARAHHFTGVAARLIENGALPEQAQPSEPTA